MVKTKATNGLEADQLGATAYGVWHRCLDRPMNDWSSVAQADQAPWMDVGVLAIHFIDLDKKDEFAVKEVSASQLAQDLYAQHARAGGGDADWGGVPGDEKVAWEAVGRHLANIIDAEAGVEIAEMEDRIVQWAKSREVDAAWKDTLNRESALRGVS